MRYKINITTQRILFGMDKNENIFIHSEKQIRKEIQIKCFIHT